MSHAENLREIFFYYVLGEKEGSRQLKKEAANREVRRMLINEFTDFMLLTSTPPTDPRNIEITINLSKRKQSSNVLDSPESIAKYSGYLAAHLRTAYREIQESYKMKCGS